jgi:hypothetical protein
MASVKITELSSSGPLTGMEVLPIVQGNETVKVTVQEIANLAGGGLEGSQYIYVAGNGTPTENGDELKAAYTAAQMRLPTSTNRISVIVGPGKYFNSSPAIFPLADGQFEFSTDYIDVISLTGNPDVFLSGISVGGLSYIKGMNTAEAIALGGAQPGFNLTSSPSTQKIENCIGGDYSFGFGGSVNGTFINCIGGNVSFASINSSTPPLGIIELPSGNIGGIFIKCTAGDNSFGNVIFFNKSNLTGTFTDCVAGDYSFGHDSFNMGGVTISGIFTNCVGGEYMFTGSQFSTLSGTFINCKGGATSFAGGFGPSSSGECSGIFNNCEGGDYSFSGIGGETSGTFTNCKAIDFSFGATASGTFNNCISGDYSFGQSGIGGTASGIFTNCVAGAESFGKAFGMGTLSGKLYYCRLTSGSFQTVSGLGKTVYCVDGNGDPNNQGFTPQNNV